MQRIETSDKVAEAIARHKADKQRIMSIGHRVYKTKDPIPAMSQPVKDIP